MVTNLSRPLPVDASPLMLAVDRWIWVFQAAFLIAIVLVGFIPDSIETVEGIMAGKRPPFPVVAHAHAVTMGAFLLLLLAQSMLMATHRPRLHMRLGQVAFVLVPLMVVAGFALVVATYYMWWEYLKDAAPEVRQKSLMNRDNLLLTQLRAGILFPLCIWIALRARKKDAGLHKRMMFLATAIPMTAAFARIHWLPSTLPASPMSQTWYVLVSIAPLLLWDVLRNRRVHRAYWIWLALFLPATILAHVLWNTAWWHAIAERVMGV